MLSSFKRNASSSGLHLLDCTWQLEPTLWCISLKFLRHAYNAFASVFGVAQVVRTTFSTVFIMCYKSMSLVWIIFENSSFRIIWKFAISFHIYWKIVPVFITMDLSFAEYSVLYINPYMLIRISLPSLHSICNEILCLLLWLYISISNPTWTYSWYAGNVQVKRFGR